MLSSPGDLLKASQILASRCAAVAAEGCFRTSAAVVAAAVVVAAAGFRTPGTRYRNRTLGLAGSGVQTWCPWPAPEID